MLSRRAFLPSLLAPLLASVPLASRRDDSVCADAGGIWVPRELEPAFALEGPVVSSIDLGQSWTVMAVFEVQADGTFRHLKTMALNYLTHKP